MRIEIHVRPGAARRTVGGTHDGALLVRVTERAERGRATAAALEALAEALDVPGRCVTLVQGKASRRKLVEVTTDDDLTLQQQVESLRTNGSHEAP